MNMLASHGLRGKLCRLEPQVLRLTLLLSQLLDHLRSMSHLTLSTSAIPHKRPIRQSRLPCNRRGITQRQSCASLIELYPTYSPWNPQK